MRSGFILLVSAATAAAWAPNSNNNNNRRQFLGNICKTAGVFVAVPSIVNANLLDDYGTDPKKIQEKTGGAAVASKKSESVIEPNLRSNYYYPTNKKRYLPRIKKCSDAIPLVAEGIGSGDWEAVQGFAEKTADDTILPMKLYTSSLTGGGTNVKVSYTKEMYKSADEFEKNQKLLLKAISKKDQKASSTALEGMATALQNYRTVGNLLGPDGGGDIPSVDDIRRAASRTQKNFQNKVKDRDSRIQTTVS